MFKKTLAMLLALLMVLSLVACGAAEEKPAETNAPAQEGEVAAPAETEAPAAEEPIKISMYYSDNPTLPRVTLELPGGGNRPYSRAGRAECGSARNICSRETPFP